MKKLMMLLVIVIIVILGFGSFLSYNYLKPNIIDIEKLDSSIIQGKDLSNPEDLKSIIDEVQDEKRFPANPRIKVFYQGVEVAYIDHEGNIYGSSGYFTNLNASITNSSFFYEAGNRLALNSSLADYLFSSNTYSNSIMSGNLTNIFTQINNNLTASKTYTNTNIAGNLSLALLVNGSRAMSGDLNLGGFNITNVGNISFGGSNNIYDNETCIKIKGATSLLEIC